MKWVYIASPYTKGDVAQNVLFQQRIWHILWKTGVVLPVAPLWSHFQHLHAPLPYSRWVDYDNEIIRRCDAVVRLTAVDPGVGYHQSESTGADAEVELAISLGIPVFHAIEDVISWASEARSSRQTTDHGSGLPGSSSGTASTSPAVTAEASGSDSSPRCGPSSARTSNWLSRGMGSLMRTARRLVSPTS